MTSISGALLALRELERIVAERRTAIARGSVGPGAVDQLNQLLRAVDIVFLASQITYFEASDPTEEEMRKYHITPP